MLAVVRVDRVARDLADRRGAAQDGHRPRCPGVVTALEELLGTVPRIGAVARQLFQNDLALALERLGRDRRSEEQPTGCRARSPACLVRCKQQGSPAAGRRAVVATDELDVPLDLLLREVVPSKSMCSRKCEAPFVAGVSSRTPESTATVEATMGLERDSRKRTRIPLERTATSSVPAIPGRGEGAGASDLTGPPAAGAADATGLPAPGTGAALA